MKFRVGRQVITHHRMTQPPSAKVASGALKVLVVSDPSETLRNVSQECEKLCEILDGVSNFQVRLIGGRGVRRISLLAAMRESDIVHFAGHSQFDEKNPENSGWLLHDGLLSASEISKLDQTPLLVFSNSCQAGATKSWQGDYLFEGQAFGLGSAFLLAGVKNYIGTFCVVHDEESRFLAVEFYRRIARDKSIGEALLEARVATAEEMGMDRLTWASYMLYGDPAYSLPLIPDVRPLTIRNTTQIRNVSQESRPSGELAVPEPMPRRIRWPKLRLRLSISITVGMLALLVFGHLLRDELYKETSSETPWLKANAPPETSAGKSEDAKALRGRIENANPVTPVPRTIQPLPLEAKTDRGNARVLPESPQKSAQTRGQVHSSEPTTRRNVPASQSGQQLEAQHQQQLQQQRLQQQAQQQQAQRRQPPTPQGGGTQGPNVARGPQSPQGVQSSAGSLARGKSEEQSAGNPKIQDHLKAARFLRERGEYARALAELEKARSLDPSNKEVQLEIENARKACNSERDTLKRAELNCP